MRKDLFTLPNSLWIGGTCNNEKRNIIRRYKKATAFYTYSIDDNMYDQVCSVIAITQTRNVKELIQSTGLKICSFNEINGINPNKINLLDLLPYNIHKLGIPIIFFVA